MTLFGLIRLFLELLARRLYYTARNSGIHFIPIFLFLVTVRFIFQCGHSLQTNIRHTLKNWLQHCGSFIKKEKSKPNFNIFRSIFLDGMSNRYREWANPVLYFCTDTSKSQDKGIKDSGSNSDKDSSHDDSLESIEIDMDESEFDDSSNSSIPGKSSTEADFEHLPESEISQKRKAESGTSESSKRSKSTDSLENEEVSIQTEKIALINTETSSESSSWQSNEGTSSVSDTQLTDTLSASSKSDRIHKLPEIDYESLSVEKSEISVLPSQDSSSSTSEEIEDKSLKQSGPEISSSGENTMKSRVLVLQHKNTKSTRTDTTEKTYPNPKKKWVNLSQDESCDVPSDPRIRKKISESRLVSPRPLEENPSSKINTLPEQTIAISKIETTDAENNSKNELKSPFTFPEINFSSLIIEQSKQKNLVLHSLDVRKEISEIIREFFKNFEKEKKEFVQTSNESAFLELELFSCEVETNTKDSDLKSVSEGSKLSSDVHPCSSAEYSRKYTEHLKEISKVKSYPGLSLKPFKVKKDARYQKKFYKQRKDIILPKKLGEVIQWMAKKPINEANVPASDVISSDEKDLPIDKYHEQAQSLTHKYMKMLQRAKEQKARKKLNKESRKEQKERMRQVDTGYVESSFKEESPSSESSSDSLPTSGDSPVKTTTPLVSRPKLSSDFDISLVQISPLKPVARVSPSFSSQQESFCPVKPDPVNIRHLSDDENVYKEPLSVDTRTSNEALVSSTWNQFFDYKEILYPEEDNFYRDMSWCLAPWPDSGQCTSPNQRETKSEVSICSKSNLVSIEQQNPLNETLKTFDIPDPCGENPSASARQTLPVKQSETQNPMCWTETTLNKYTTARKKLEYFESSPISVSSGQEESLGHGITAEEESAEKETCPSSSPMKICTEGDQQIAKTADSLRSTPEKNILSTTEVLESDPASSDPASSDPVTSDNLTSVTSDSEISDS